MKGTVTTIGEHCTVTSSKRVHLSERSKTGVPFYCSKEIIQKVHGQEITECDYIGEEYYEEIKKALGVPKAGDLLITTRGTYGIPYLYTDTDRFYFADGNLTWLKDFDDALLPQYLYYWVLSHEGQKKIDAVAKGTAQKAVPIAALKSLELHLPPLKAQRRSVEILSAYDSLIENDRKQIKLLEEAARCLYKEWFVDLRFPGYEDVPVADGMPEGWEIQPLSGVLTYVRGRSYASDDLADAGGTIMVNLKSLKAYGGYNWNTEKHFMGRVKQEQLLEPGDIVMGVTDMTQERRLIGYVAMVPGVSDRMTFSMDLIKLVPLTVEKSYLYALMLYGGYSERISRAANGVNVLHLKPETMMDMSVLVPSNRVMRMYDAFFKQCQEKAEALQKQCSIASEARDRLLSKLMSRGAEM